MGSNDPNTGTGRKEGTVGELGRHEERKRMWSIEDEVLKRSRKYSAGRMRCAAFRQRVTESGHLRRPAFRQRVAELGAEDIMAPWISGNLDGPSAARPITPKSPSPAMGTVVLRPRPWWAEPQIGDYKMKQLREACARLYGEVSAERRGSE